MRPEWGTWLMLYGRDFDRKELKDAVYLSTSLQLLEERQSSEVTSARLTSIESHLKLPVKAVRPN